MPARSGTSSSMHTTTSLTSSWLGSSPSRSSPQRQSPARNGFRSPATKLGRRSTMERQSPSSLLTIEFSQMLIKSDQDFNKRLDDAASENAKSYMQQIAKAALEHERVRAGAEREVQRLQHEQELERLKREEEQRQELERLAREKAKQEEDARRKALEAKQREEQAARHAAEQARLIQEAEDRVKAQKEREEAMRRQKAQQEEADRKAREDAAAAQARAKAAQQAAPAAAPAVSAPPTAAASKPSVGSSDVENIHARFLELHQRMKDFHKPFRDQCKQKGHPLKAIVGDVRRELRLALGQTTIKREDSKAVITKIRTVLKTASEAQGPTVDIRNFIISYPLPNLANESEAQYPAILLYAFICLEKSLLKQFEGEGTNEDGKVITELAAISGSLFVDKSFTWKHIPFTDILLAKLHRVCPVLFGISGPFNTASGRQRLGWLPRQGSDPTEGSYGDRMIGLASGFAALSLRTVNVPAIPMSEYWRAIASICNTPAEKLEAGHFLVLRGLIRDHYAKFVSIYGVQGRALLRKATINLPAKAPQRLTATANTVSVFPSLWKSKGFDLETTT